MGLTGYSSATCSTRSLLSSLPTPMPLLPFSDDDEIDDLGTADRDDLPLRPDFHKHLDTPAGPLGTDEDEDTTLDSDDAQ